MRWSATAGWEGITPEDRTEWAAAYPGCDLDAELARATAWLKANPTKASRSNWRRFLVGWLTRSQDKGGTHRTQSAKAATGPPPADAAKRRWFRADAQKPLTDAEYAAWRRDQRTGGIAASLAQSLTLREDA